MFLPGLLSTWRWRGGGESCSAQPGAVPAELGMEGEGGLPQSSDEAQR